MHREVMDDELACLLGEIPYGKDIVNPKRDCNHCGYDIENGEEIILFSWLRNIRDSKNVNEAKHPQWNVIHPLCMIHQMAFYLNPSRPELTP